MLAQLSLRTRLVLLVFIVAVGAIVVVDVATWRALRASSYDRLDQDLHEVLASPPPDRGGLRAPPGRPGQPLPADTWRAVLVERDGETYARIDERVAQVGRAAPGPQDDAISVRASQRPRIAADRAAALALVDDPHTLPAAQGDRRFRVAARRLRGSDLMVAAIPTDDIESTMDRLVRIELIVSVLAALGVALLAFVTVRAGLRPLEEIAATAAQITGPGGSTDTTTDTDGKRLTPRVPVSAPPGTEVGQLAMSLNAMLDRIDDSFDAQRQVEQQLRRFVADASHELRTPLTSIQGYAELARTKAPEMSPQELEHSLRNVEEESQHLGRLVEDLLLLSRFDQQPPLEQVECDVVEVAARAVSAAQVVEPGRTIELVTDGPVTAFVDPVRIRQLLDNLLTNVRVHAGEGATATVRVRRLPAGGGCELLVTDTGPGLAAADHERATDRFWRADAARTRATGGSGLGLSIVRSLAQAHGGTVQLGPGPDGAGLSVTVTLPAIP